MKLFAFARGVMHRRPPLHGSSLAPVLLGLMMLVAPASAQDWGPSPTPPPTEAPETPPGHVPAVQPRTPAQALAEIPPSPPGYHRITEFAVGFIDRQVLQPEFPRPETLATLTVTLARTAEGFTAPFEGAETISATIAELGSLEPPLFDASAVEVVARRVRDTLIASNRIAHVLIEPLAIEDRAKLRPDAPTRLRLIVEIEVGPFRVDELVVVFHEDHPSHPTLDSIRSISVRLSETPAGYIAARPGLEAHDIRIGDIPSLAMQDFHASALREFVLAVRDYLLEADLIGVYVAIDPNEIKPDDLMDQRLLDQDTLTLLLFTGIVTETRTLAFGERIPVENRLNNPLHQPFIERSPFQVWDGESERRDLLRKTALEEYLFRQNRIPGRRVDAALSEAEGGGAVLDYLIAENKPFFIYAQVSNTGTKQTDRLRERFGFIWNQVTGNDDLLTFEYVTANFDAAHALLASYEAPVGRSESLRWRAYGSWSEFTASDVGLAGEEFTGESWSIGAELAWNIFQHREFFLDLVGGARWMYVDVNNKAVNVRGENDFFLPYAGVRFERETNTASTRGSLLFEWSAPGIAGTDDDQLNQLGRLFVDDDWMTFQWDLSHSFYLEPLLNRRAWEDVESRSSSTLAHEIALSFRGQHAFGNRLIPQAEQVLGGLFSVRGYPESVIAGDTVYIGSLEYRFHLPKSFPYDEAPGEMFGRPFRRVPQEPYGSADWNLVLKAFVDIGRSENSDRLIFENDETLIGAGVGVEFSFLRNVNIRVDWGFALKEILDGDVEKGDNRVHFVATFLF